MRYQVTMKRRSNNSTYYSDETFETKEEAEKWLKEVNSSLLKELVGEVRFEIIGFQPWQVTTV